jgi:6-phosphogluconolactonase
MLLLALLLQQGVGLGAESAKDQLNTPDEAGMKQLVFIGGYSSKSAPGILAAEFDPTTGLIADLRLAAEITNPSFLAVHPNGKVLYAVSEVGSGGRVSAFAIDHRTGVLQLINSLSTEGDAPCHLSLTRSGKSLFVANYSGGSTISYPVDRDGSIHPRAAFIQHEQRVGHRMDRQEGPHAHGVHIDPDSRFLLVPDLGLDQVLIYRIAGNSAGLKLQGYQQLPAGAGPRHLVFHPTKALAYVINELDSTVSVMGWSAQDGALQPRQRLSTLPEAFTGPNTTAEIVVHPSGRFLYGSNRGHDSIAVFGIQPEQGLLQPQGHVLSGGKTPRFFTLDPSGRWLVAANQQTGNLVVFPLDLDTGMPGPSLPPVSTPSPTCVVFVP